MAASTPITSQLIVEAEDKVQASTPGRLASWELEDTTDEEDEALLLNGPSDGESTEDDDESAVSDDHAGASVEVHPVPMRAPPGLELPEVDLKANIETLASSLSTTASGCVSPTSTLEHYDFAEYSSDQTIIIFDWDDTICPTTTCGQRVPLGSDADGNVGGSAPSPASSSELAHMSPALSDVVDEARRLLERASELADRVVIVTNAGEGWVEWSCNEWLPGLLATLDNIEIFSARSQWEPLGIASPTSWKELTFRQILLEFGGQLPYQSTKNIICVGDAPYEHEALTRVVNSEELFQDTRTCKCKNVKFMAQPSAESLAREMQMLRENLGIIVAEDQDVYQVYVTETL